MPPPDTPARSRRGVANVELFGGDFMAARARSGIVTRYLIADGLIEASKKWAPSTMEMYATNVHRRAMAKARAGKEAKRLARQAAQAETENGAA